MSRRLAGRCPTSSPSMQICPLVGISSPAIMRSVVVSAVPEVSSTAKAYSFHAKNRQKIAVEAMPVAACGSTTLKEA